MKPHLKERNEQFRKEYKKFLVIMKWREAVHEVAKRHRCNYHTTEGIIFRKGKYRKLDPRV